MPDDAVPRGDLEALRSDLKDEIATTRLEVAQLRTDMSERFAAIQANISERFGAVQAEFGAVRADLADVRKDLAGQLYFADGQLPRRRMDVPSTHRARRATVRRLDWSVRSHTS